MPPFSIDFIGPSPKPIHTFFWNANHTAFCQQIETTFLVTSYFGFFFFFFLNVFDLPISSVKMRVFNKIAKSVPFEKRVPFAIFSHNK